MDDLLYTLFVIAWIAYGIYKGVKKNKTPEKKPIPVSNGQDQEEKSGKISTAFESILSEVFDLPKEENDKISHVYHEEDAQKSTKTEPVYENYLRKEVLDSYKGTDSISSAFDKEFYDDSEEQEGDKIFDNQVEEEGGQAPNTVFDLRQAIIHQVILERPY